MADIALRGVSFTIVGRVPPCFSYRSARILDNVSLDIKKGELVAIMGEMNHTATWFSCGK